MGVLPHCSLSIPSGGCDKLGASEVASESIRGVHLRLGHDFGDGVGTLILEEMGEFGALDGVRLLVEHLF